MLRQALAAGAIVQSCATLCPPAVPGAGERPLWHASQAQLRQTQDLIEPWLASNAAPNAGFEEPMLAHDASSIWSGARGVG